MFARPTPGRVVHGWIPKSLSTQIRELRACLEQIAKSTQDDTIRDMAQAALDDDKE